MRARKLLCRYCQIRSHVSFSGSDMFVKAHCSHDKPREGARPCCSESYSRREFHHYQFVRTLSLVDSLGGLNGGFLLFRSSIL